MSIISETKNELTNKQKNDTTAKLTRNCPKCNSIISYKSKYDFFKGQNKNTNCKTCSNKIKGIEYKNTGRFAGTNNPFYGKKHSDETRKRISEVDRSWMTGSLNPMKNETTKKYFSKMFSGIGNPMYGKSISEETRKKLSIAFSGKNNPMYGKPTPNGSGNGWANWYKGIHFRSLRELQYYITEIDKAGVICESAQGKRFRIPYKDYNGVDRTYRPDFFIDNHWLIEIKPKKLWNTREVVAKKNAAEQFCREMGYEYKLVDVEPNSLLLKEKYLNGEIKFVEKYRPRFEKHIGIVLI